MKRFNVLLILAALALLAGCNRDPKVQSDRFVSDGDKYFERGKYKEASIMYRRALQKNMKNSAAWYKLGLIGIQQANLGEARGSFARVADLAEEGKRWDASVLDALGRISDIDYTAYTLAPERLKASQADLEHRRKTLEEHFPGTFDAYRVAGLHEYTKTVGLTDLEERAPFVRLALENFLKADKLKPYDSSLGFAIIATLAENRQVTEAEAYANEMIARKTADDRVYSSLYTYYLRAGRVPAAEQIRRRQVQNQPNQGSAWIALASHYFVVKNHPEMLAALTHLTSDLKTFPNAFMMTGDFYMSSGDFDTAIKQYGFGVKADTPNKAVYLKKTAEALTLLGNYGQAGKLVSEILKDNPQDPEGIAMEAALQMNTAKREDADKIIGRLQPLLAKTSPEDKGRAMILHFNIGRAYALKGDAQSLDQARLQFQEVLNLRDKRLPYIPALMALGQLELQRNENPQAIDHATQVLVLDKGNVTARLIRTMALMNQQDYDRSRLELAEVLKFKPDSKDALFQLGRLNLLQKRYGEAEDTFAELEKLGDSRGMNGVLQTKILAGKKEEAAGILQAQVAKSPADINLRGALAALEFDMGRYPEAAAEFKRLIDENPKIEPRIREEWYLRVGETYRRLGNLNSAMIAFSKAAEIAPKHAAPRLELAMLYDVSGKAAEAKQLYDEVLKLDPDNPVALNNVAYSKADTGSDLDQALALAQRARSKAPQDPNILDTLGLIYLKKGLYDDSVRVFTELVTRYPDNATYHLHMAMAYAKKDKKAQALRELDATRKGRPTDREQLQIKDLRSRIG